MAPHSDNDVAYSAKQQGRITIIFLALGWFFLLLRVYTRTFIISSFGWDDSTMVLAVLVFTLYCVALLVIEANGGGTHITSVPLLQKLLKWVVISETAYVMAMLILKISLGIFFARIVAKRWHFLLIYITVGVNIFSSAAAFFYSIFRCGPNLDDYVLQQILGHCTPRNLDRFVSYQQAAFTTVTDLVFVILPLLILWNANMSRRSKLSVGAILILATVGCVCSILRFRYIEGLSQTDDFFWHAVNIAIWSSIECGTCIIAGCMATLRPLVKRLFQNARDSSNILSGCMKQVSYSFKSTQHSTSSSQPSHKHAISSKLRSHSPTRKNAVDLNDMSCLEFLPSPGQEVIPLDNDFGKDRKSTDHILEPQDLAFPWPLRPKDDKRRQTMHANWTLRQGVSGDGRTAERPATATTRSGLPADSGNMV